MSSRLHGRSLSARFQAYLRQHLQALSRALQNLARAPLSNLVTLVVLAIALALPSGLYVAVTNLKTAFEHWEGRQLSLFVKLHVTEPQLLTLATRLRERDDIAKVDVMTREQSLQEFRRSSGLGSALDLLDENPLPAVLLLMPEKHVQTADHLRVLADELSQLPEADQVIVDQEWLEKLFALVVSIERVILVIALFFAVLLALVITLVLRLELVRHRQEVEVTKLVGGSNAFIQRPFLYAALLLGFTAALLALGIAWFAFGALEAPLSHFVSLYGGQIDLRMPANVALTLVVGTSLISLIAAWTAMKLLLWRIEPI
ncbi:MAG: cell division protein FtsX [Thiotrichales bacterium]